MGHAKKPDSATNSSQVAPQSATAREKVRKVREAEAANKIPPARIVDEQADGTGR